MSDLSVFKFEEFEVRLVGTAEQPEWVASDIAKVLGINKSTLSERLAKMPGNWKGVRSVRTPGGNQDMATVFEPGLYELIFRSDKPVAQRFRVWMFEDVLPSIRKTGKYELPKPESESLDAVVDDFLAIIREAFNFAGEQFIRIKEQSVSQQRKLLKAKLSDPDAIYEVALEALNKVDHTVTHQSSKVVNHSQSAIASLRERLLERLENSPALVIKYKEIEASKKRSASGWIHPCLKKVGSVHYPLVSGERDPDNLEHWYWVYRWAEKNSRSHRKNGCILRGIQLKRYQVKTVQFAIDCGANRERIVEQLKKNSDRTRRHLTHHIEAD